jgi:hypothetical protein
VFLAGDIQQVPLFTAPGSGCHQSLRQTMNAPSSLI